MTGRAQWLLIGRWRRLSARARLTIWYVTLLAGTLIGLISLGTWLVQHELYVNADQVLRSKAAAVSTEIDVSSKGKLSFDAEGARGDQPPTIAVGLDVVRIWAPDHRLVYSYPPGITLADPKADAFDAAMAGGDSFETLQAGGGEMFRLLVKPLSEKGKIVGVIQVGRSLAEVDGLLTRMRGIGLLGMLVGLVVAWAGGSFLADRVLRPVDRIRRAAERIGAEDLSLRLDPPASEDELGKLVSAFNHMIERLERSFAQQQRFTADASHELRTPLAVIRSLAEVALSSPRNEAYDRRVYTSICDESERLTRLLESLLVLARADERQMLLTETVDLDDVVLDAAERVAPRARQHGVHLNVMTADGEQLVGDANWLTQLLVNLLDNALSHTPAGGRVTLSAQRTTNEVVLRVADTGDGIAPEHLPRIFDRFYRVDAARSRATGGFGLGLAICRWIAQAHRGEITVTSELGSGTTVEVRLPRSPGPLVLPTPSLPPARTADALA